MPTKQPSFSERRLLLQDAVAKLHDIAEIIATEAIRMAAAEKRFSERRGEKTERRAP